MNSRTRIVVTLLALLPLAAAAFWIIRYYSSGPTVSGRFPQGIYVWQRKWTDEVTSSVLHAGGVADRLFIFGGTITALEGRLRTEVLKPDWATAAASGRPVTPVLRAQGPVAPMLARTDSASSVARAIASLYSQIQTRAAARGCKIVGLQLDYDCATSKLDDYRALMDKVRHELPGVELSITTLPSWLSSWSFAPLAHACDWYVLQVHGAEKPTRIDEPVVLCRYDHVAGYIARAGRIDVPFRVALPTYGYRVVFDKSGNFSHFIGETPLPDEVTRDLMTVQADPVEVAEIVANMQTRRPAACRGVIWFRLPVESDDMNWNWDTLEAVMAGHAPSTMVHAEFRRAPNGAAELHLHNLGNIAPPGHAKVRTSTFPRTVAHDVLGEYREQDDSVVGPIPKPGKSRMIAWYRFSETSSTLPNPTVEVVP